MKVLQSRQQKIDAGLIWQVYKNDDSDNVLFEGVKTKCQSFIRINCPTAFKKGEIRLGKLIYEPIEN